MKGLSFACHTEQSCKKQYFLSIWFWPVKIPRDKFAATFSLQISA